MKLSSFITQHMEQILVEWEAFAATFGEVADKMSSLELRDHAKEILEFVAQDMVRVQSVAEAANRAHGHQEELAADQSASATHGKLRYASGFTLMQLIAEYRALRASVLKLWPLETDAKADSALDEVTRFNEAIDQSLAESTVAYSNKVHETRDIFLAILGHDLRGPLASVATAGMYLTRPGAFNEQVEQIGTRVTRSAATMNGMVNDLLELARTQLGEGFSIKRQDGDLVEMCHWAIEDAMAAHPRAKFATDTSGELLGLFDFGRLQQMITNLANNAAQYGSVDKSIIVSLVGEKDYVRISVKNEGIPIPIESLPKIFTSLVQLPEHGGHARPRSSLGLGLFIAKQIAVAHGGDLTVVSNDVMGTIFTADLPRH